MYVKIIVEKMTRRYNVIFEIGSTLILCNLLKIKINANCEKYIMVDISLIKQVLKFIDILVLR